MLVSAIALLVQTEISGATESRVYVVLNVLSDFKSR